MLLRFASLIAATASLATPISLLVLQSPAIAETSVGIAAGGPGYYGQINVGNFPVPTHAYYPAPVVIEQRSIRPVYLQVPEYQAREWEEYCHYYRACGRQVYLRVTEFHPYREYWHGPRWRHHEEEWHRDGGW